MALQTRRMRRNAVMLSIQQQNNINHRRRKTMWVYPRPQFWFEQLVVNHYQDHLWREHFRVSRDTFEYICGLVGPQLIWQNTILRQAITVEKRVAVALWRSALKQVWSWPRNWTIDLCRRDCKSIETRSRIKVVSHFEPRGKLNYDTRVW